MYKLGYIYTQNSLSTNITSLETYQGCYMSKIAKVKFYKPSTLLSQKVPKCAKQQHTPQNQPKHTNHNQGPSPHILPVPRLIPQLQKPANLEHKFQP